MRIAVPAAAIAALFALAIVAIGTSPATSQAGAVNSFKPLTSFNTPGSVAEIIKVTPDGQTAVYTDADEGAIGFVDISDPANPTFLEFVDVGGEPTSVDVTPDGTLALANVRIVKPEEDVAPPDLTSAGALVAINVATRTVAGTFNIGFHPDSLDVATVGNDVLAVIAIENEPIVVEDGVVTDDDAPGNPNDVSDAGFVQIVTVNQANIGASTVTNITFPQATLDAANLLFTDDPQPEFVDINGSSAAVSLQENNGIAIIDLATKTLTRVFSLGVVADRPADLVEDDAISFSDTYPADVAGTANAGARFPDAIAFSPDGTVIYSADEGEVNFSGGRGWSAWDLNGNLLWDDGGALEAAAVTVSHYPEGRSENKGIEMEGVTTAIFDGDPYAFVLSERGSFVAIYDISNPGTPVFVQILPTGVSPEGVVAIPDQNVFITADEVSGTLSVFEGVTGTYAPPATAPLIASANVDTPWAAISGLAANGENGLVGVPDNAVQTEIYAIGVGGSTAPLTIQTPVLREGAQARYDGEGITTDTSVLAPANAGWWLASEGNAAFGESSYQPNLLVQVDATGAVLRELKLPAAIDSPEGGTIRSNGFEGVAVSADGNYLVAPIQRQYAGEDPVLTRIAQADLRTIACDGLDCTADWQLFRYPLDPTDSSSNWVGLSELISIGPKAYAVLERDKELGGRQNLKKVYAFSLAGLSDGDTVTKVELADLLDEFAPYEKVEGLALMPNGDVWAGLDNDGGEVASVLVNLGRVTPFVNPPAATGVSLVASNGGTAEQAAITAGATGIFAAVGGDFLAYVQGAPSFVNADFLNAFPGGILPAGTGLLVAVPS